MGEAFDRSGNKLAESYGPTRTEVLRDLERQAPDAAEMRIRSMKGEPQQQQDARTGMAGSPIPGTRSVDYGLEGYSSQELSLSNIDDAMRYQPWHEGQQVNGDAVRDALVFAAKAILRNCPRSPRRTLALQHLISARMDANCAISFGGRF